MMKGIEFDRIDRGDQRPRPPNGWSGINSFVFASMVGHFRLSWHTRCPICPRCQRHALSRTIDNARFENQRRKITRNNVIICAIPDSVSDNHKTSFIRIAILEEKKMEMSGEKILMLILFFFFFLTTLNCLDYIYSLNFVVDSRFL